MKRFLLDSGPAQDFCQRRGMIVGRANAERHAGNRVGICVPVLGELLAGAHGSETREKNIQRIRVGVSRLVIWPYDEHAADAYGKLFAQLRKIGRPMPQIDIMIAAIAFALGNCVVVARDSDFHAIPGLEIANWDTAAETTP